MFKKVQLKFFSIITAILVAVFFVLLCSVNIIMDTVMERQTKVVLQQVAKGVEYNSNTATFTFTAPDEPQKKPFHNTPENNNNNEKPPKPKEPEIPPESSNTTDNGINDSEPYSQEIIPETRPEIIQTTVPVEKTEKNPETKPKKETKTESVQTSAVQEKPEISRNTQKQEPEISDIPQRTEPASWNEPQFPDSGRPDDWNPPENDNKPEWNDEWQNRHDDFNNDRNNWNNHENQNQNENKPEFPDFPERKEGFVPTAYNYFIPVLNGYTITNQNINPYEHKENEMPDKFPKVMGSIDFFVIMADENGKYTASLNNDDLTADSAQEYIDKIISGKKTSGMTGNLSFCTEKKSNGTLIVLTDRTAEMDMMNKLKRTTVIVGIISIILLSGAAYFLSGLIVRPLRETFDKQKQFISDASHELKTPLTVISANADVLAGEIGENKWLTYIQEQAGRMNILVNDLLSLTRLENKTRDFITSEFDLSRAVENAALPFECQAFESGKNFVLNIEEGIRINANEQHIRQMTGIFIDNALKYSKEKGTVRVSLVRDEGKTVLSVYNTGNGVRQDEVDRLFERFYRSDESRNRSTGGYGLGLAIAKSIIDKHNFRIQVENQEGKSICFVVTMN
ncbi:MAG: GHKL domain-containing protein [Ruminococcus sp.]|nr:GHKL domain-containing protein [Ruminococcus sp.]